MDCCHPRSTSTLTYRAVTTVRPRHKENSRTGPQICSGRTPERPALVPPRLHVRVMYSYSGNEGRITLYCQIVLTRAREPLPANTVGTHRTIPRAALLVASTSQSCYQTVKHLHRPGDRLERTGPWSLRRYRTHPDPEPRFRSGRRGEHGNNFTGSAKQDYDTTHIHSYRSLAYPKAFDPSLAKAWHRLPLQKSKMHNVNLC